MAAKQLTGLARWALGLGAGGWALNEALFDVDGGERAVIFNRFSGVEDTVYGEGTHFRIPVIQYPIIYDVRARPRMITTVTGTKDMQMVNITLRVLSRPDEPHLPEIYRTLGEDFDFRVLPSVGNEVLKAVVAQFNADQLLTQREKVSALIRSELEDRSGGFNILLDDVAITHLTFGKEFTTAIEQKQVAEQEAERAKFVVMKTEQEKQAAIIAAEGESEAAELISSAVKEHGAGMIEVRRIDAARDIANTLSRSRNVTYIPSQNNMLLSMN